jgi:hypothetical protein
MTRKPIRLALDQNFPIPLLEAVRPYLPKDLLVESIQRIDPRMSSLDDRPLLIALQQKRWDGLITNNYRMLYVREEVAAIVGTKLTIVAIEGLGHDPLRATGALLLELPSLADRIRPGKSNVFHIKYPQRQPVDGREFLKKSANRHNTTAEELWNEFRPSGEELNTPVI